MEFQHRGEISQFRSELLLRIENSENFHSPVDQDIARDVLARLDGRLESGAIVLQEYERAVVGLEFLVPRLRVDGKRRIGDKLISPPMEKTIASRLDAEEVDLFTEDAYWGGLPDVVKKTVVEKSSLIMEMTSGCTVKCSFCSLAKKGAIKKKISFDSVLKLLEFFRDGQDVPGDTVKSDGLYWGTDPFDAKWLVDGSEYDYSDLAEAYWKLMEGEDRFLYSSTAIPLGEELRILKFADKLIEKKRSGEISEFNRLRISCTNVNEQRALAIMGVLSALYGDYSFDTNPILSDNRHENVAMTGGDWDNPNEISNWDVLGVNCRDGVVISPDSVDALIMEAGSNERPVGESRFPILVDENDEESIYFVPHHAQNPPKDELAGIYPDTKYTRVRVKRDKKWYMRGVSKKEYTLENIHRTFLRVVGMFDYFCTQFDHPEGWSSEVVGKFMFCTKADLRAVQAYVEGDESNNRAMASYLHFFEECGIYGLND